MGAELQLIDCDAGVTLFVGAVVFIPTVRTVVPVHPVEGSIAVTVIVFGALIVTVLVLAVNEGLVQL